MAKIYTYKQVQDRVLRRAGRDLINDTVGRDLAKDTINEIYTDIQSRRTWRHLFNTEQVTYPASDHTKTLKNLYSVIDNVYSVSGSAVKPLKRSTRLEFNRFVRDASNNKVTSPSKYFQVGNSKVAESWMHPIVRVYPIVTASLIVNFDGYVYPEDLSNDKDIPILTPMLIIALIKGTLAAMFEVDEDARTDSMFLKYESDIEKAAMLEDTEPDQWERVGAQLLDDFEDELDIVGARFNFPIPSP